ncbi:hypothetical protein SAMN02799631_00418 [Methylobacterium sp. 174MFSha1.1]|uniref:hypothetical protein n=1 Tax=Methylobacterium sp. 174MFSha1.1 TaxID=1502749 RepID=UPI0008E59296|nr:hypothetical protein [Methylobacterium sp. 174MFSha1.1]SFU39321.1 hypothetical protein SAMN02799631_00418 [Methylobacterium sp. 174MFSha1.1]
MVVCFERRPDGGLRAWSDAVPEFVLSHKNVDALLADIKPALKIILSAKFGEDILTEPLVDFREALEERGIVEERAELPLSWEYVAQYAQA